MSIYKFVLFLATAILIAAIVVIIFLSLHAP